MEQVSENQGLKTNETIRAVVREFHTAIKHKDAQRLGELVVQEVFVFGAAANEVSTGRDQFVAGLCSEFEAAKGARLGVKEEQIQVGICDSGLSAWFLDRFDLEIADGREAPRVFPIRFTGLLVQDLGWRLAAAFWSIPLRSNDYQYELLQAGKIQPGFALENQVASDALPLVQSLQKVMAQPKLMPDLYATRPDAFTIGSTVEEVMLGVEGKNWVQEIVQLPLHFTIRGGVRGALAPDGCTAWMATHVDLSGGLMVPYRFFYIWHHGQEGWKIVVSHDAVSIDPSNPTFDIP
jgi:ketosteroid isomerase-like protein